MIKEIAMFDIDGVLWNIDTEIWLIDKEKPYKPILKIDNIEFSLIKNGFYKKDNILLDYNGNKFYISRKMYDKVYKKTGFENIARLGLSFINYNSKEYLDNTKIDFLLDNIDHLRGKNIDIGLLTARSNQKIHADLLNELRLKLKDMHIPLTKIFFTGDRIKFGYETKDSINKIHILLEHLIGFKIKNNRFIPIKQDWYNKVHFYDDNILNIDYANNIQFILDGLLKLTDDELFRIIIDRLNEEKLTLYTHLVTNNKLNKFKSKKIILIEPIKYPLYKESMKYLKLYEKFKDLDFEEVWEEEPTVIDDKHRLPTVFSDFLEENGALYKFINNFEKQHPKINFCDYGWFGSWLHYGESEYKIPHHIKIFYRKLIMESFIWDYTPEGGDFWQELNYKWMDKCNKDNIYKIIKAEYKKIVKENFENGFEETWIEDNEEYIDIVDLNKGDKVIITDKLEQYIKEYGWDLTTELWNLIGKEFIVENPYFDKILSVDNPEEVIYCFSILDKNKELFYIPYDCAKKIIKLK